MIRGSRGAFALPGEAVGSVSRPYQQAAQIGRARHPCRAARLLAILLVAAACPLAADEANPLARKKLLFCGDSITAAVIHDNGARKPVCERGWASFVGKANGMASWMNMGRNGATISDYHAPNVIYHQLDYAVSTGEAFDCVLIAGGTNDAWYNVDVGEPTDSFDPASFDRQTFAGGLEYTLHLAKKFFPESAIGFIVNFRHNTTESKSWGRLARPDEMRAQYALAAKVCKKWDVPCLDLYNDDELTKKLGTDLPADKAPEGMTVRHYHRAVPDVIHPSNVGYAILEPVISAWLKKELAPRLTRSVRPTKDGYTMVGRGIPAEPRVKVLDKPLKDCSIGFFGDRPMGEAAKAFARNYPPKTFRDYTRSGATIGKFDDYPIDFDKNQMGWTRWMSRQLEKGFDASHDFVIALMPTGDAEGNVPVGEVSAGRDKATFDVKTFAGGLDHFFASIREKAPDMKVVFASFPYPEPNAPGRLNDMDAYWDVVKKLCAKWDVLFLDLYHSDFIETSKARAKAANADWYWGHPDVNKDLGDYLHSCLE